MELRTRYVDVRLDGSLHQTVRGLYQYDHGLKLRVSGVSGAVAVQMQFSCTGQKSALTTVSTWDDDNDVLLADIPDVILMQPNPVYCYFYVEGEDSGVTVYEIVFPLLPRARPQDGSYTPAQIDNYDQLMAELQVALAKVQGTTFYLDETDGCLYMSTPTDEEAAATIGNVTLG